MTFLYFCPFSRFCPLFISTHWILSLTVGSNCKSCLDFLQHRAILFSFYPYHGLCISYRELPITINSIQHIMYVIKNITGTSTNPAGMHLLIHTNTCLLLLSLFVTHNVCHPLHEAPLQTLCIFQYPHKLSAEYLIKSFSQI